MFFAEWSLAQTQYQRFKVSNDIDIIKITNDSYVHVSYADMPPFGRVASNGLLFTNEGKAVLFDTPATDSLTKDLVNWIEDSLKVKITAFVPNHWHADCMGGLAYLNGKGIESYADERTIQIAKSKNLPLPLHGFKDSLKLNLSGKEIMCNYFGAAHTTDNIVVWIPSEKILFAGCMIKDMNSKGLGNTADGDLKAYPRTVMKVLNKYHHSKIVIPGHGSIGGAELLEHTLKLSERL